MMTSKITQMKPRDVVSDSYLGTRKMQLDIHKA